MKFIQVLLILGVLGSLNACPHTKKESLSQSIHIDLESEQVQDSLAFSLFVDPNEYNEYKRLIPILEDAKGDENPILINMMIKL